MDPFIYIQQLERELEAEKLKSKVHLFYFMNNKLKAHRKSPPIKNAWNNIFRAENKLLTMLVWRNVSLTIANVDTKIATLPRKPAKIYNLYLKCPLVEPGPNALEDIIILHKGINKKYQVLKDLIQH